MGDIGDHGSNSMSRINRLLLMGVKKRLFPSFVNFVCCSVYVHGRVVYSTAKQEENPGTVYWLPCMTPCANTVWDERQMVAVDDTR